MNIAFYSAYTAMQAYQSNLNIIGNNMANVNTVGYKSDRASFDDLLYSNINVANSEGKLVGRGTKIDSIDLVLTQGSMQNTSLASDFALTIPEGFFAIQKGDNISYTRNGSFAISNEEDGKYLVDHSGAYVMDKEMQRILLENGEDGKAFDEEVLYNAVGVFTFANPYELTKHNGTKFTESAKSGTATAIEKNSGALLQYFVENSNANISDSMVDIIATQRAFQTNAKVIQTADEMEEAVNTLRR